MKRFPMLALALLPLFAANAHASPQSGAQRTPMLVPATTTAPPCKAPFWSYTDADGKLSDKTLCGVSVLYSARQRGMYVDRYRAAFRNGVLTGIERVDDVTRNIRPAEWTEVGKVEGPSGLWWGRNPQTGAVAVGYESYDFIVRHFQLNFAEIMRREGAPAAVQLQMDALQSRFSPFPAAQMRYVQSAPSQSFLSGGLGGMRGDDNKHKPAPITNAQVSIATLPDLQGTLTFNIEIQGKVRTYEIPLKNNLDDGDDPRVEVHKLFRLRHGIREGNRIVNCKPVTCRYPYYDVARKASEGYAASGSFFGPNSEYLAIKIALEVDILERSKSGVRTDGIVILRAQR